MGPVGRAPLLAVEQGVLPHPLSTRVRFPLLPSAAQLRRGVTLADVHGLLHTAGVVPTLLSAEQLTMLCATATGNVAAR